MNLLERLYGYINRKREIIHDGENTIEIVDDGYEKVLAFNGVIHSRIPKSGAYTHQYWDFFLPLASLYDRPRILMIGLGGGAIISRLRNTLNGRFSIDVVEVSEKMAQAARSFFDLGSSTKVIVAEGAEYVHRNREKYDLIIVDAYVNTEIPLQFFTPNFISDAYNSLSEKGILAINYLPQLATGADIDAYAWKLRSRFKVYRVNVSITAVNVIIMCMKGMGREEFEKRMKDRFAENRENRFMINEYMRMEELR
jgi:spermidine synthase